MTAGWYYDYNGTGQTENMTFSATTSGTVSLSISVSATVDANAIIAGAQATTSLTLQASMTATIGNAVQVNSVPPGVGVYAAYGVFRNYTTGDYTYYYSNCTWHDYGIIKAWVPDRTGWTTHN